MIEGCGRAAIVSDVILLKSCESVQVRPVSEVDPERDTTLSLTPQWLTRLTKEPFVNVASPFGTCRPHHPRASQWTAALPGTLPSVGPFVTP